jgi:hypothetical protein
MIVDLRPFRFLARIDMRSAFSSADLSISFGGSGGGGGAGGGGGGGGKTGIGAGGGGLGALGGLKNEVTALNKPPIIFTPLVFLLKSN